MTRTWLRDWYIREYQMSGSDRIERVWVEVVQRLDNGLLMVMEMERTGASVGRIPWADLSRAFRERLPVDIATFKAPPITRLYLRGRRLL